MRRHPPIAGDQPSVAAIQVISDLALLIEVVQQSERGDWARHDSVRGVRLQSLAHHHGLPQGSQAHSGGDGGDLCANPS